MKKLSLKAISFCAPLFASTSVQANRYFDSASSGSTWDTTSAVWGTASGGPYGSLWVGYDLAFFEGTGGAVTLSGQQSANHLSFSVNGYTLTGGTLNLGSPGGGAVHNGQPGGNHDHFFRDYPYGHGTHHPQAWRGHADTEWDYHHASFVGCP